MNVVEWTQVMLSVSLQVAIVLLVAWQLDRWSMKSTRKSRIWTACFLSIFGLVGAATLLPRLQLMDPWQGLAPTALLNAAAVEYQMGRALLAIWCLGVLVMLVRWIWDYRRVATILERSLPMTPDQKQTVYACWTGTLKASGRTVDLRICPSTMGPFCYQLHHPMLFLPASLFDGDFQDVKNVVQHEMAHLEMQHPLQLFLQRIIEIVFWFHPLVWISTKRATLVREFVCDDSVRESGVSTAAYLRTLLRLVESRCKHQTGTLAIGRSASELRLRAQRLAECCTADGIKARIALPGLIAAAVLASQIWLPTNPLANGRSRYTPWPTWTAATLHAFDISVSDFAPKHERQLHELLEEVAELE